MVIFARVPVCEEESGEVAAGAAQKTQVGGAAYHCAHCTRTMYDARVCEQSIHSDNL